MEKILEKSQTNAIKEIEPDELKDFARQLINAYHSEHGALDHNNEDGEGVAMTEQTLIVCELVGQELLIKTEYQLATQMFNLVLKRDQLARYFVQRAECLRLQGLYVEAARDLAEAANLAPSIEASLSSE